MILVSRLALKRTGNMSLCYDASRNKTRTFFAGYHIMEGNCFDPIGSFIVGCLAIQVIQKCIWYQITWKQRLRVVPQRPRPRAEAPRAPPPPICCAQAALWLAGAVLRRRPFCVYTCPLICTNTSILIIFHSEPSCFHLLFILERGRNVLQMESN